MVNQVAKSETNSDEHVVLFRKHPIYRCGKYIHLERKVINIGTKKEMDICSA